MVLEAGVRRVGPWHRPPQVLLSVEDEKEEDDGKNEEGAPAVDVVDPPYRTLPLFCLPAFMTASPSVRLRAGSPFLHRGGGVRLYYVGFGTCE